MEQFLTILVTAVLVYGFIRLCMAPIGLVWKIGVNTIAGFLSLWLLNLIAGFLGLPGIAVLAVLQFLV